MRVLLSAYDSRGGVAPLAALAVQLRALGVDARVSAPPDPEFVELLAGVGVPLLPFGESLRAMKTGALPSETDLQRQLDGLIAVQFDTVAAAAEGCAALVVAGFPPAAAAARSVTESLGIPYVYVSYQPTILPSPHYPPPTYANAPFPLGMAENRLLWQLDGRHLQELFGETLNGHRASTGLPPLDNLRDYALTDSPWLATDPVLDPWRHPGDLDVVQTGAWLLPDERPLPAELAAFLDAGDPPVYVGFGSMPMRASQDLASAAIEAIRAQGHRALVSRGWADLDLIDDQDDCLAVGEVNHRALFERVAAVVHHGGAGTTTTAARAGAPQVVVPQGADQPYWATRVRDLGIGAAHDGPAPTAESLSTALKAVLTEQTRARASSVAATIRTDGASVAATLLMTALPR
jgi:vancomycin aglycone glucosyltransferase